MLPSVSVTQQRFPACRGQLVFAAWSPSLRSCASNLCKPLAVSSHFSTSFNVFFGLPFLSHQLLKVVPLLDPFLHLFSPRVSTIATFFSLRNSSNLTTPVISRIFSVFILSYRFSHISFATFSFLWSSVSFHFPFSMPNIQHHKLENFSHSFRKIFPMPI